MAELVKLVILIIVRYTQMSYDRLQSHRKYSLKGYFMGRQTKRMDRSN